MHGGRLACSVDEAARLTGLSRDLLYDQMRLSNLACVKVGMWRLITCQDLQQLLGHRLLRQRPDDPRPAPVAARHHRQGAPGSSRPCPGGSA